MKIVSYKILEDKSQDGLERRVNLMLNSEWQPLGGVIYTASGMVYRWLQAMVKYE